MASAEPHWPAPVSVESRLVPSFCCSRPARRRCSACASRPGSRPRTCSRCGRRIQRLFQPAGAIERRGPPLRVDLPHLAGNLDLPLPCSLPEESGSWERAAPDRPVQGVSACRDATVAPSAWGDRQRCCTRPRECGSAEVVLDGFHAEILSACPHSSSSCQRRRTPRRGSGWAFR
jgi:hypothetical protein